MLCAILIYSDTLTNTEQIWQIFLFFLFYGFHSGHVIFRQKPNIEISSFQDNIKLVAPLKELITLKSFSLL